jgi:hypothetical protein
MRRTVAKRGFWIVLIMRRTVAKRGLLDRSNHEEDWCFYGRDCGKYDIYSSWTCAMNLAWIEL